MTEKNVLVVDQVFNIKKRGIVICGMVDASSPRLNQGDNVEIVRPDGVTLKTVVSGIEHFIIRRPYYPLPEREHKCFLFKNLTKDDVPIDSVLRLSEEPAE